MNEYENERQRTITLPVHAETESVYTVKSAKPNAPYGGVPAQIPGKFANAVKDSFRSGNPVLDSLNSLPSQRISMPSGMERSINERLGVSMPGLKVFRDSGLEDAGYRGYARGNEIHIGGNESPSDEHLMMHEATHVFQQGTGMARGNGILRDSALESHADAPGYMGGMADSFSMPASAEGPVQGLSIMGLPILSSIRKQWWKKKMNDRRNEQALRGDPELIDSNEQSDDMREYILGDSACVKVVFNINFAGSGNNFWDSRGVLPEFYPEQDVLGKDEEKWQAKNKAKPFLQKAEATASNDQTFKADNVYERPSRGADENGVVTHTISIGGPGTKDKGKNSTEATSNYMTVHITNRLQAIRRDNPDAEILLNVQGHSRGGVAASKFMRNMNYVLANDAKVKANLVQYDPVPGGIALQNKEDDLYFDSRRNDSPHNGLLADVLKNDHERIVGNSAPRPASNPGLVRDHTVAYSLKTGVGMDVHQRIGYDAQEVYGANRYIISKDSHSAGHNKQAFSLNGETYGAEAGRRGMQSPEQFANMPSGVFMADKQNVMTEAGNEDAAMNLVDSAKVFSMSGRSIAGTRKNRIKNSLGSYYCPAEAPTLLSLPVEEELPAVAQQTRPNVPVSGGGVSVAAMKRIFEKNKKNK